MLNGRFYSILDLFCEKMVRTSSLCQSQTSHVLRKGLRSSVCWEKKGFSGRQCSDFSTACHFISPNLVKTKQVTDSSNLVLWLHSFRKTCNYDIVKYCDDNMPTTVSMCFNILVNNQIGFGAFRGSVCLLLIMYNAEIAITLGFEILCSPR